MNDEKRKIPDHILRDNPNAHVVQIDFHGFTEYSCSKVWPSEDPKDSPHSAFQCHRCKYTFYAQIYGRVLRSGTPGHPLQPIYDEIQRTCEGHHKICKIAMPILNESESEKIKPVNLDNCAATSIKAWVENANIRHLIALRDAVNREIAIRQREAHFEWFDERKEDDDERTETR